MKKVTSLKLAAMTVMVLIGAVGAQAGYYRYGSPVVVYTGPIYQPTCKTINYQEFDPYTGCYRWFTKRVCN